VGSLPTASLTEWAKPSSLVILEKKDFFIYLGHYFLVSPVGVKIYLGSFLVDGPKVLEEPEVLKEAQQEEWCG
jgi:hypothetical protein